MIDFHSHILHKIDDGPKTKEEAVRLLQSIKSENITEVVCTPHFYPDSISIEDFISKRNKSFLELSKLLENNDELKIILGAEVYCNEFLLFSYNVDKLCIKDTDLILLELPFASKLDKQVLKVIDKIIKTKFLRVVIAHADRYPFMHKSSLKNIKKLCEMGCIIQINCDSLEKKETSHIVLNWMDKGYVDVLGTDCHDDEVRAPNMLKAKNIITEHFGESLFDIYQKNAHDLLYGEPSDGEDRIFF